MGFWIRGCGMSEGRRKKQEVRRKKKEVRSKKKEVRSKKDRRLKIEDRVFYCGRSGAVLGGVSESSFCLALTAVFLRSGGLEWRFRAEIDWFVRSRWEIASSCLQGCRPTNVTAMTTPFVIASVTQWSAAISRCQAERLFKWLQNCGELEPCPAGIASSRSLQGLAPGQRSAEPASFVNAMTSLGKA